MVNQTLHRHFKIYKPYKFVSQFISNELRKSKKQFLGKLSDFPDGTMAIGRLDEKSEGLLLLTTDGKESERVRSKKVEKEYYAQVDGIITEKAIEQLQKGVDISTAGNIYHTRPCKAYKLESKPNLPATPQRIRGEHHGPTSWVSLTLTEGKYRQVRKMTAIVGFPTLRLVRVRIGNINIKDMQPGDVVEVDNYDV